MFYFLPRGDPKPVHPPWSVDAHPSDREAFREALERRNEKIRQYERDLAAWQERQQKRGDR